ncbi:helix-turn-helix domain-containing protein [Lutimonas zeaxanthinifaciens]|uniref:helix-turn-helix domain-containing protein n=1 Tax=Lutimonas zeaxanthinifaciens TaxID=3060215 RepID=UPI00265CEC52|nr:helix-turn-helix domain-containing protein [Lutimonas sp. YSD2104]WKK67065.1 helix-turn-helix domain-containing protein [Lutimonas sp. YSD2104]
MDNSQLAIRIKELRSQKGMSQEFLAEESGLSLRTIQRVEKGESNPTGDSLKRLANALNITPDDLLDWAIREDKKYLTYLNLSALTFLFFPLLGILIPFMIWTAKRGKIKNIDKLGKDLINYQITWTILLFLILVLLLAISRTGLIESITLSTFFIVIALLYLINVISIWVNTIRISNEKNVVYSPQIRFLK